MTPTLYDQNSFFMHNNFTGGKMKFSKLLSLTSILLLASCVEQKETEFNEVLRTSASFGSLCSDITDKNSCDENPDCQSLLEEDMETYQACIAIPDNSQLDSDEVAESSDEGSSPDGTTGNTPQPGEDAGAADEPETSYDETPTKPGNGNAGNSGNAGYSDDQDNADSNQTEPSYQYCGKNLKKIIICHIPPGNHSAAHSICISKAGWENGHKDNHGSSDARDYLGACELEDLD